MTDAGSAWLASPGRGNHVRLANVADFAAQVIATAQASVSGETPQAILREPRLEISVHLRNRSYETLVLERLCTRDRIAAPFDRATIVVASPGEFGLGMPPLWGDDYYRPREVEKALEHTPFRVNHLREQRYWQVFNVESGFGVQWMAADDAYPPWESGAPLRAFLHWHYSARGMRLAHAGALGRERVGVLLVGRGGSGKSGTVVGGLLNGLETVGDDYVLVQSENDSVTAHSIFTTLKQDLPGLERLGLDAIRSRRRANWQDKYEFFCADLAAKRMADSLAIKAIVLPQTAGGPKSAMTPTSPGRAMLALAPTGLSQMPGERDSGVTLFAKLVRTLPCFSLHLGTDPAEVAASVDALLAGLPS